LQLRGCSGEGHGESGERKKRYGKEKWCHTNPCEKWAIAIHPTNTNRGKEEGTRTLVIKTEDQVQKKEKTGLQGRVKKILDVVGGKTRVKMNADTRNTT